VLVQFILPRPNRMAFFTVLPGQSFHAVEEVFRPEKLRLSISGWYHADELPEGIRMASLSQLQAKLVRHMVNRDGG
jgi:prolyl 3-hydroxylase /prolyl 3,4-dihydroxylase